MNKHNRGYLQNLKGIFNDILVNVIIFVFCYMYCSFVFHDNISLENAVTVAFVYLLIYIVVGLASRHYDISSFFYLNRMLKRVTLGCLVAMGCVVFIFYFSGRAQTNRIFYALYFMLCYGGHLLAAALTHFYNRKKTGSKNTLLIGPREEFHKFVNYIEKTDLPFDPVGYVSFDPVEGREASRSGYIGNVDRDRLDEIIRSAVIDQVYIMKTQGKGDVVRECIDTCVELGVETRVLLPLERDDCSTRISSIGNYPVISFHMNCINPGMDVIKRTLDIMGALVGIVLFSPVLLLSALAIKLDSPGPVFFTQTRVGKNGRRFKIIKLRTMTTDAESRKHELMAQNEMGADGLMFKMKDDPRITKVGAFLRKMSFDEIPQFFNVLIGDMSLVGTRPPTEDEVNRYTNEHWRRLRIKPGITGLWQISGRSAITDFDEIVELDTKYIRNWSLFVELWILIMTVGVVFKRKGAY